MKCKKEGSLKQISCKCKELSQFLNAEITNCSILQHFIIKMPSKQQDQAFIRLALNLSKKNIGITAGNPSVGCVLVKNQTIISTGVTQKNGIPHAENIAISKAGENSIGATAYITLEPCSHFGKTPPCADLIIKSKISRVVIATIDPDSRVNGQGIKKLQEAGIEVIVGILEDEARQINQGFFTARTLGRPFITLKLATSLDGKIAAKNGDSKWITNEKSRQYAHYLRAKNDAILVGAATIRADNPMLDCRINGLEKYSPKRIILSSSLNIDPESQIIQSANSIPTYIATNLETKKFEDLGVKIINFKNDDLNDLAKKLPAMGINNLLIEGGSIVAEQFLKAELIDKFIWIKSPKTIGTDGIDAIANFDINQISQNFKMTKSRNIDEDLLMEFNKLQ
ncbi:MAG: bifunctional diaminohydroxyphosphoribosylaminopyrimidine deaminase/5-amino-6-(5-phosphoribosylamino)uracil reductase RibD [Pseudomonadota bacterium]